MFNSDESKLRATLLLSTWLAVASHSINVVAVQHEEAPSKKVALDQLGDWYFSNSLHSSFSKLGSTDAQEGQHLLEIDSGSFTFPYETEDQPNKYSLGSQPRGFLFQTILADRFTGKHIHISAFAKDIKPNFEEIKKRYRKWFLEEHEATLMELSNSEDKEDLEYLINDHRETEFSEFDRFIKDSHASSNYGVTVLLHFKEEENDRSLIVVHTPTSVGAPKGNELWNRFNVELGVPENCEAISIVLWSKGVTIVQYDHVAVVAHGEALASESYRSDLFRHKEIYKAVTPLSNDLTTNFKNLSFEE